MTTGRNAFVLCFFLAVGTAMALLSQVKPQVLTRPDIEGSVMVLEVGAHFVTAIRMAETVNSVVVGDPALFQVEHSDREPQLVFVKALTAKAAQTNLLISTTKGHQLSVLVRSPGEQPGTS